MNGLFLAAVFCVVAATCIAQKVPYHDCGTQLSTINEIDIVPCPSLPCIFTRNSNVTLTVKLTPNTAVTDAKTVIHGVIDGIAVPFPVPDDNACNFMACPLAPAKAVTYTIVIAVKNEYPPTNLVVKWEVTSSSGELFCFTVPATITN